MTSDSPLRFTLKLIIIVLLFTAAAILMNILFAAVKSFNQTDTAMSNAAGTSVKTAVIIDAGHGGMDGGAVSITGTSEKELNLAISRTLAELMRMLGVETEETRTEDIMLCGDARKGTRKMTDLKNRLAIAEANPDAVFVSLHMNKFSSAKYSGLQVWYSKNNADSAVLADIIKTMNNEYIQPDNKRTNKAAGSDIYLLDRIKAPAVMVECGFLSNADEAALLDTEKYRNALAAVFAASICRYLDTIRT